MEKSGALHFLNNLGVLLWKTAGRLDDAIAQLETAQRLQPDNARVHHNLGLILAILPIRLPVAIEHLLVAVRLEPEEFGFHARESCGGTGSRGGYRCRGD